jgi:hypothetical protein
LGISSSSSTIFLCTINVHSLFRFEELTFLP